jgi:hypothetical protein
LASRLSSVSLQQARRDLCMGARRARVSSMAHSYDDVSLGSSFRHLGILGIGSSCRHLAGQWLQLATWALAAVGSWRWHWQSGHWHWRQLAATVASVGCGIGSSWQLAASGGAVVAWRMTSPGCGLGCCLDAGDGVGGSVWMLVFVTLRRRARPPACRGSPAQWYKGAIRWEVSLSGRGGARALRLAEGPPPCGTGM